MITALVIEDDRALRRVLVSLLTQLGLEVTEAATFLEGDLALRNNPHVVLVDLGLPDGDGRVILEHCRDHDPWIPAIVLSGQDGFEVTVEAMQRGAYDYLVKPPDRAAIASAIDRALSERRFRASALSASEGTAPAVGLVGRSPGMRKLYKQIALVGARDVSVLVSGETGVGKELVARAIHSASPRASQPFVALNCATLSSDLWASELFGHVRGAFTGATGDRIGKFETVGRGTLFLDEVGELSLDLQAKLLRVLQERSFERVGDGTPRQFRGRILSASNRDIPEQCTHGSFRSDLYYRLSTVELSVPSLRERAADIPMLVRALLPIVAEEAGGPPLSVPDPIVEELCRHSWPGNVRELRNVLQRMTVLSRGGVATRELLYEAGFRPSTAQPSRAPTMTTLAELEAAHVANVLAATSWHKGRTSEILGISRPTLDRKIKEHGLQRDGLQRDPSATPE